MAITRRFPSTITLIYIIFCASVGRIPWQAGAAGSAFMREKPEKTARVGGAMKRRVPPLKSGREPPPSHTEYRKDARRIRIGNAGPAVCRPADRADCKKRGSAVQSNDKYPKAVPLAFLPIDRCRIATIPRKRKEMPTKSCCVMRCQQGRLYSCLTAAPRGLEWKSNRHL